MGRCPRGEIGPHENAERRSICTKDPENGPFVFIGETGFEPATARPPAREIRARPVLNARVDWGLLGLSATERTGRGRPR